MLVLSRRALVQSGTGAALTLAVSRSRAAEPAPVSLTGVGSSFPAPLLQRWAADYRSNTGVAISYTPIGSAAAIAQVAAGTVDFGVSTAPLFQAELIAKGLGQRPFVAGGIVPVVNLPGLARPLRLEGRTLAGVFLGRVRSWSDPVIARDNPGLTLPALAVTPVHYAEGSGATFVFTSYLSAVDAEWRERVGAGLMPAWPSGLGSRGNSGVAALVKQTAGAIGFVEAAFAASGGLQTVVLRNRSGEWTAPTPAAVDIAVSGARLSAADDFRLVLVDAPGRRAWPIVGVSYMLLRTDRVGQPAGTQVRRFLAWALNTQASSAVDLGYAPLRGPSVQAVVAALR